MLLMNNITELLGLVNMCVTNMEKTCNTITLFVEKDRETVECPRCRTLTNIVHDYRIQTVKDLPVQGHILIWKYRKRRYRCPQCGKRFTEKYYLLPKGHQITNRTALHAVDLLTQKRSRKDIAKELNVSESTMTRFLRLSEYGKPSELPPVLSIDEFKGNTNHIKYHGILTDPVSRKVLDITPDNYETHLYNYLKEFRNRKDVKYFISDMRKEYISMAKSLFPNATIVIDKFHVARYCTWSFENVRKRIQKSLSPEFRKYFKRSRKLLLKRECELTAEGKHRVAKMLEISKELAQAYLLKEKFYEFMDSSNSTEAKEKLKQFFLFESVSSFHDFQSCITMLTNWEKYILNAFDCKYTNGFTEGCNNTIKVIKRTGYGYRNFDNFRCRILMTMNKHS